MTGFAILSTTAGNPDEAQALGRALVEAKLAACVQIMPVTSVYRWEGAIETAQEQLLLCKIVATDFDAVEAEIRKRHSYEVPEIVTTPITAGHGPYLDWIGNAASR